jgi:hypothetical protein
MCRALGIDLFHIWEDDWLYKKELIKSMIKNKLGLTKNKLSARNCQVKEVKDIELIRNFLKENHIQGYTNSKYKIGLFYKDELVSLMLFGKSRNNSMELSRFCNKKDYLVRGSASKLFKWFLNNKKYKEIISYSDISYSTGNLYEKLGFVLEKISKPDYSYVLDGLRKHKSNFSKNKLLTKGFIGKSEKEIMLKRKIYKVYNCGLLKYSFRR